MFPPGTNCAYCEPISADLAAKLPPGYRGRGDRMVVNTEWADFRSPHLPTSAEDVWVDCSSAHPGAHSRCSCFPASLLGQT